MPVSVHAAWKFIKGFPVEEEELAVQGVTNVSGIEFEDQLIDLPETLEAWRVSRNHRYLTGQSIVLICANDVETPVRAVRAV